MKTFKIWILLLLLFGSTSVIAQKFEVAPTRMDFNLEPGQTGRMMLNVKNHSDKVKSFTITTNDWMLDSKGDIQYLNKKQSPKSCSDWISISPNVFDLAPNESKQIAIQLSVPNDSSAMETKWSMLFIHEATEKTEAASADKTTRAGVIVNPSIGVYVFQTPNSFNKSSATIGNFKETEKNKRFSAVVTNTGAKIIQGKVYLQILDLQTAQESKGDPIEFTLLPGVIKHIEFTLPPTIKPGKYSLTAVLDYSPDKDLEGAVLEYEVK